MQNKTASLHSTFSVNGEVSDDDTRFLNITIDVLHLGENLNKSAFSKDVVDSCIDSIKNTPVLGFIRYDDVSDDIDFKGHEHVFIRTNNGVEEKYLGSAYGLIPETCNPRWTAKMCSDGQEREFLQVDAMLWTKFDDSVDIVTRDVEKAQSMELEVSSVDGYEDEDGVFHFTNFRFDGCCILGDGVQPAMVDANVMMKEVGFALNSDFIENIQSELNNKFTTFTKLIDDKSNQGGVGNMGNTKFEQTVLQQFQDIVGIVSEYETIETWYGTAPRFSVVDVQDNEVIVIDQQDGYRYYGFQFSINGDKPEIDFACKKRKKCSYTDYVDGSNSYDGAFDFGEHIENIKEAAFEKINDADSKVSEAEKKIEQFEKDIADLQANYSKIKSDYDEIKPKYDEYVKEDEQRQIDELNAQKDAKFAEYEDMLADNAEFAALKERRDEMSIDDINKECAVLCMDVIRSKNNFSKQNVASAAIAGVLSDGDTVADNVVHIARYGNIRVSR